MKNSTSLFLAALVSMVVLFMYPEDINDTAVLIMASVFLGSSFICDILEKRLPYFVMVKKEKEQPIPEDDKKTEKEKE